MVFFDIGKAFDKMWHKGQLYKLEKSGIRENVLPWFRSYLYDRKHYVIKGSRSGFMNDKAGVPQDSILGPLLFLIFKWLISNATYIKHFADDTSVFITAEKPLTSGNLLNSDLDEWSKKWGCC